MCVIFALPIAAELSITESTGYLEILRLSRTAKFALTDSGGLQEETTYLGIPCLTLRDNTERPVTIDVRTNVLTGSKITGEPAVYHVMSRTALDGFVVGDVEKDFLLGLIREKPLSAIP